MSIRTKRLLDLYCCVSDYYQWQIVENAIKEFVANARLPKGTPEVKELLELLKQEQDTHEPTGKELL